MVLLSAFLTLAGIVPAQASTTLSLGNPSRHYVEQEAPFQVFPDATVTSVGFGGGRVEVGVASAGGSESLSLAQVSSIEGTRVATGEVTVFNNEVYLGRGVGQVAEKIGSIDSSLNGYAGTNLRINFSATAFTNSDFEAVATANNIPGWTVTQQRVFMGSANPPAGATSSIAGFETVRQPLLTTPSCTGSWDENVRTPSLFNFTGTGVVPATGSGQGLANDGVARGEQFLKLRVAAENSTSGAYVVRGPHAVSEEFSAVQGQVISFDWLALGPSDRYVAYGALLRTEPTLGVGENRWTTILSQSGSSLSAWQNQQVSVPVTGTYRFVFIAGNFNADCGRFATGELYIDNVNVVSNTISQDVAQQVLRLVRYENSSDAPSSSRTITVTGSDTNNSSFSASTSLSITPVDDPPVLNSSPTVTFVNTANPDTFSIVAGTIDATDPDGDSMTLSAVAELSELNSHNSVNYDRKLIGNIADVWFSSTSLAYAVIPNDAALELVSAPVTDVFELEFSDAGSTNPVSITVIGAYDMKLGAPAIDGVESEISQDQTSITFDVEFDEFVSGFGAADITLSGASGTAGTWTISEPTLIQGTTKYRFTASNPNPINGSVDFSISTSGVQDFASPPNNLSSGSFAGSAVQIDRMPLQSLGQIPALSAQASAVLPNYLLDARGDTLYGVRISVTDSDGDFITGDSLSFTNSSGMGNIANATSVDGVLRLSSSGNSATAVQWQAAIRAVLFASSSNSSEQRQISVHIDPRVNYLADSGRFYQRVAGAEYSWKNWQQSFDQAATYRLRGLSGYLANVTSQQEQEFLAAFSQGSGFWLGQTDKDTPDSWYFASGPETGEVFFIGDGSSGSAQNGYFTNWSAGEPNAGSDFAMMMTNGFWDNHQDNSNGSGNYLISALMVEFGDNSTATDFGLLRTANFLVDLVAPGVTSVSSTNANRTYFRGEEIIIAVDFTENVVVTGVPRLELETGATDRTAEYLSGSGSSRLLFKYTVQLGDSSADLDYVASNSLQLNGGSIKDAVGNVAALTLSGPGAPDSLGANKVIVVDGNGVRLELSRVSATSSSRTVSWTLNGSSAINCSTLSVSDGVDFDFERITSIDSITPSNSNKTCTITATSSVLPAQFGTSSISASAGFSVDDSLGVPRTVVVEASTRILVSVAPVASGKGSVSATTVSGTRPDQYQKQLNSALFPGVSPAVLSSLKNLGMVEPPAGAPKQTIAVDHSAISDPSEVLNSISQHQIPAGDSISLRVEVSPSIAAAHRVASYVKSGPTWLFAGIQEFENGVALTNSFSLTEPGTYTLRLFVVPNGTQVATQSLIGGFAGFSSWFMPAIRTMSISESSLPTANQTYEAEIIVIGSVTTAAPAPAAPAPAPAPSPTPTPTPTPTPSPTPIPTPTPSPTPTVSGAATPMPSASAAPAPSPSVAQTPSPTPAPSQSPSPTASEPTTTPTTPAAEPSGSETSSASESPAVDQTVPAGPIAFATESFSAAIELLSDILPFDIPVVGEPVENLAIGASGDDSVIVEFDPLGTPEAVEATNKLLAATGAIAGVAAAAGAAAAAAAAAGAAGAAASAAGAAGSAASAAGSAAGSAGASGAEMTEDVMDAMTEAGFELDAFTGEPPGRGDNLGAWSLAALVLLDKPTRVWTRRTARFSPLLSKLLNDGIYLRAMLGSVSVIPLIAAVVFAVLGLQENAGTLLHPPVPLFLAIGLIGLFDSFAGVVGISVFILGSLPLVDPTNLADWRMLAGTAVAGFGPILIARSIRNFRRKPIPGVDGLIARIGDIAFASLMGGWVAGLVFRALPALTGLTVPAANHVATFQLLATIAIALRIILEDVAARNFPHRMDALAPDALPEPPRAQVIISLVLKYLFYVFVASAFMGLDLVVWIAAAMFMIPTLLDFVRDKLPVSRTLWRWLPIGLPGLAMILGLEILLENALSIPFGEDENFSIIFILSLISMLIVLSLLGALGRSGRPGEQRLFEKPSMRWVARLGGLVTFILLVQFTSML